MCQAGFMRVAFWQASHLSCSVALRNMAAKQGKGYQTLIHELLEKAASRES
jgi:predicted DNA binding CopG/RHH family protein